MKTHLIAKSVTAALAVALSAPMAFAGNLDGTYLRIKQASDSGDLDALEQVVRELDASADKSSEALLAASVADYRIAGAGQRDTEKLQRRIDAAIGRAESRLAPWANGDDAMTTQTRAEGLALLASTWGLHISMHPMQGPFLGSKASDALRQAQALAPEDARVQLASGMQLMFLPPLFGGDRTQALHAFERVATLIPKSDASATNWGLDDAWIWRGIALQSLQRPGEAKSAFQTALDIDPANGFAQSMLGAGQHVAAAATKN